MGGAVIRGEILKEKREAMGLAIEELSRATNISSEYLEALEDERYDAIPSGPYAAVYTRAVCRYLGIDSANDSDTLMQPTPPQGAPLWFVRALAVCSVLALVLLMSSLVWERLQLVLPEVPLSNTPDQRLVVVARRDTDLVVLVDGSTVLDRKVAHGEQFEFIASETVEVRTEGISHLRLEWNGVAIVPQGRQEGSRTLLFVDDRGVGW